MTENMRLIWKKLEHLRKMKEYLAWSLEQVAEFVPISAWSMLTPEQHESLAAFRVRFNEFQEHIGKTMRAIALEEEENTEPFGAVLAYMEKLEILDSVEHWRLIRELRNSVNHEYEEDETRITEFFKRLVDETPVLFDYYERMRNFYEKAYAETGF